MGDTHQQGLAAFGGSPPAVQHEPQRAAALVETAVAQRAELPEAGGEQRGPDDQLWMLREPGEALDRRMDAGNRRTPQQLGMLFKKLGIEVVFGDGTIWDAATIVNTYSTTKGIAALALHMLFFSLHRGNTG